MIELIKSVARVSRPLQRKWKFSFRVPFISKRAAASYQLWVFSYQSGSSYGKRGHEVCVSVHEFLVAANDSSVCLM